MMIMISAILISLVIMFVGGYILNLHLDSEINDLEKIINKMK